jgi:hypothetical protein
MRVRLLNPDFTHGLAVRIDTPSVEAAVVSKASVLPTVYVWAVVRKLLKSAPFQSEAVP